MTLNRSLLAVAVVLLFTTAAQADVLNFSATIDESQEVPPTGSAGTGSAAVTFDDATNELSWNISWSGLTGPATGMHFHDAPAGSNGPVVVNIGAISGLTSPSIGSTVIDAPTAAALLAGELYINIHSGTFPPGEIRGQVVASPAAIPTVSEWGLIVLGLLILTAGTIIIRRETARPAVA